MKTLKLVGWIFAVFGLLFMGVGGGVVVYEGRDLATLRKTTGQVVSNEYALDGDGARAVVRFETSDGRQVDIRSRMRTKPPAYSVGERVTVRYDPATPDNARIDGFMERWFLPLIFGGLGSVFFLIGFSFLLTRFIADRRDSRLRQTGERRVARVLGAEQNTSLRVNGRHPWRVRAEWSDTLTGERHVVLSRHLEFDPTPRLEQEIDVYVDPSDKRKPLVDLSKITGAA